jgi:hypothetical protein
VHGKSPAPFVLVAEQRKLSGEDTHPPYGSRRYAAKHKATPYGSRGYISQTAFWRLLLRQRHDFQIETHIEVIRLVTHCSGLGHFRRTANSTVGDGDIPFQISI